MKQLIIEATKAGVTGFLCVDRRGSSSNEFLVIVDMECGRGLVDFEFTPDDCIEATSLVWIQHDVLNNITSSLASTIRVPFQGFRLNVLEHNGGTIKLRVVQGGFHEF